MLSRATRQKGKSATAMRGSRRMWTSAGLQYDHPTRNLYPAQICHPSQLRLGSGCGEASQDRSLSLEGREDRDDGPSMPYVSSSLQRSKGSRTSPPIGSPNALETWIRPRRSATTAVEEVRQSHIPHAPNTQHIAVCIDVMMMLLRELQ